MIASSLPLAALFAASALASPLTAIRREEAAGEKCHGISGPFLGPTFPDPSLLYANSSWYSFATYNGKDVQAAKSSDLKSGWERLDSPILAIDEAKWVGKEKSGSYGIWAPDVFQRSDNKFVMYFSAFDNKTMDSKEPRRCISAAISDKVAGVYHPVNDFVQCNRTSAGAIDPSWFKDSDGSQYVIYKTEIPHDYLEIREVRSSGPKEGVQWAGNAQKLLKVDAQGYHDGGNMEAPYIFKRDNTYFLTYSTHFTGDGSYDVQYATAKKVTGPYTRVEKPLLKTGDDFGCNITGPGGASFYRDGKADQKETKVIFHGLTAAKDISKRVMYTGTVETDGGKLSIKA